MSAPPPPKENLLLNLACTVAAPALILSKLSGQLGSRNALCVALAFPLAYGLYDAARRRQFNFLAALGFTSTLATGGLGLMKLDPFWLAVKEAAVPQWTKRPLVRTLLFNDQVIDVPRVDAVVAGRGQQDAFDQLLRSSSWLLAGSFALSAVLNYVLARMLVTALPETPEFNVQLGRMTWMSYLVISLPMLVITFYALWRLFKGIQALTGLTLEEILRSPPEKKSS
jgi:hypothetical protein